MKNLILIVGTGRSGTSLLKSILDNQKNIASFGNEFNSLWHPGVYPEMKIKDHLIPKHHEDPLMYTIYSIFMNNIFTNLIRELFFIYIKFKLLNKNFLIKSSLITFLIPMFVLRFKKIKIICLRRNKHDFIRSMIKKNFIKNKKKKKWKISVSEYSKELENLYYVHENFYNSFYYKGLKSKKILLEVNYKNLTKNTNTTLKKIQKFCNLENKIIISSFRKNKLKNMKKNSVLLRA